MPITSKTYQPPAEPSKSAIGAIVDSILNAPGSEFGPSPMAMPGMAYAMVFQKAGAPALRQLFGNQIVKETYRRLRSVGGFGKEELPEALSWYGRSFGAAIKRAKLSTPMVERNLEKIKWSMTGKPVTLIGFRAHGAGGPVPGRGIFYSAYPHGAVPYYGGVSHGNVVGKSLDVIKFKNPIVTDQGQYGLMQKLVHGTRDYVTLKKTGQASISPALRKVGKDLLNNYESATHVEKWYTKADKWIARVAKSLGHDGIVYKGTEEIVDLAGTVTKR